MEILIKFFLEFIKLAPRYFIAIGIFAAFFLFSPENILKNFSVFEFTQEYRKWFGVLFVLAFALSVAAIIATIAIYIKKGFKRGLFNKGMIQRLHCLTEYEKQILRFYFAKNTKTNVLNLTDGVVLFWFSVNWRIPSFELTYPNGGIHHAQKTTKLHRPGKSFHSEAPLG